MMPDTASMTPAGRRWQAMAQAHRAQSQRLHDPAWEDASDFKPTFVESFRSGRGRRDDAAIVAELRPSLRADDTFVDVGAGAGRFALPVAGLVREVVAVEPSPPMADTLEEDARRAGVTNVRLVRARWQDVPELRGDVLFSSHTVYSFVEIEPFLGWLTSAGRRQVGMVLFAAPPLSWLAPFWPLVHGEERLPAPHLPQLLDVLGELGLGPVDVTRIDVEPFALGPFDAAVRRLRRRLYVLPGTAADEHLGAAMRKLLDERDGQLVVRGADTVEVGLVRWPTDR